MRFLTFEVSCELRIDFKRGFLVCLIPFENGVRTGERVCGNVVLCGFEMSGFCVFTVCFFIPSRGKVSARSVVFDFNAVAENEFYVVAGECAERVNEIIRIVLGVYFDRESVSVDLSDSREAFGYAFRGFVGSVVFRVSIPTDERITGSVIVNACFRNGSAHSERISKIVIRGYFRTVAEFKTGFDFDGHLISKSTVAVVDFFTLVAFDSGIVPYVSTVLIYVHSSVTRREF